MGTTALVQHVTCVSDPIRSPLSDPIRSPCAPTGMRAMESGTTNAERNMFDITAEMARQYKGMQANLVEKVEGLELENTRLKEELGEAGS